MGFDSNVDVVFERGVIVIATAGPTVVRACIEQDCGEIPATPAGGPRVAVIIPSMPSDADVHVSVKVTHNSQVIFSASTAAHTRKWEPAGPGCGTAWRVLLTAHADGRLTERQ
jgi:hypothetical protein